MLLGDTLFWGRELNWQYMRPLGKRKVNIPACWTVPALMPQLVCNLLCIFIILLMICSDSL